MDGLHLFFHRHLLRVVQNAAFLAVCDYIWCGLNDNREPTLQSIFTAHT